MKERQVSFETNRIQVLDRVLTRFNIVERHRRTIGFQSFTYADHIVDNQFMDGWAKVKWSVVEDLEKIGQAEKAREVLDKHKKSL